MLLHNNRKILFELSVTTFLFLIVVLFIHVLNTKWNEVYNIVKHHPVHEAPRIPQECEVQKVLISSDMQKASAWRHTSAIGTTNNPTIDGGIINAVDGLAVNQPPSEIATARSETTQNEKPQNNPSLSYSENYHPQKSGKRFSDEWATSSRVKTILNEAIKTGKLDYVLTETDARKMPASVALVPVVESSYKNNAVSNKGAEGSWQLMPETARENGIRPEERMQFVPATKAALNFLSQLHQEFGSWELAFAAYNAGGATVKAAIQKNPSATTIDELDLPQETKNYVLRLRKINKALISEEKNNSKIKTQQA